MRSPLRVSCVAGTMITTRFTVCVAGLLCVAGGLLVRSGAALRSGAACAPKKALKTKECDGQGQPLLNATGGARPL